MRTILAFILIIGMSINFTAFCAAPDTPPDEYDIPLVPEPSTSDDAPKDDRPPIELPPNRHRTPGMAVHYTISQESGLTFTGCDITDEIVSYEIYDITGTNIAIFSDEQSFIDFIFSGISGEFQIRFRTDSASYSGYLKI